MTYLGVILVSGVWAYGPLDTLHPTTFSLEPLGPHLGPDQRPHYDEFVMSVALVWA